MKFTSSFTSIFTTVAILGSLVAQATPTAELSERNVFVPRITSPVAGDVWFSRQTAKVTWDTSDAPAQITNRIGFIVLRKANLATPVVLADNFDILDGNVTFEVPLVFTGDNYSITLFGDSGNVFPDFTIQGH